MTFLIPKGSAAFVLPFNMVESSDHNTPLTGATPTVTLSKNGGAFASPSGAVSEIASSGPGGYVVAGNATDTNTVGPIMLYATATSGDPVGPIVVACVYDPAAAVLGVNGVQLNGQTVTAAAGVTFPSSVASPTNITAGTITTVSGNVNGNVAGSVGSVTGAVGSVTGAVGSVTGNVGGNVVGSVASVTAAVTITGDLSATMKTSVTTACTASTPTAAAVTGAVGSVTGNVGGSVASVVAAVTITGDLSATMKASVTTACDAAVVTGVMDPVTVTGTVVVASGTVTTVSGNVNGSVGSVAGNVAGSVASVTAGVTVTTNNDKTGYALNANGSTTFTESYAAKGQPATLPQLLYMILALLSDFSIAGTTLTATELDGSTPAATFALNDATDPTSITRAT